MNEIMEKYLSQMLEGYERNLAQVDTAIDGLKTQLQQATDAREEAVDCVKELKDLLGLSEEAEAALETE